MACNCKGVLPVELTLGAISVGFANGIIQELAWLGGITWVTDLETFRCTCGDKCDCKVPPLPPTPPSHYPWPSPAPSSPLLRYPPSHYPWGDAGATPARRSNGDGKIDASDEIYTSLKVLTGEGKMSSLADAGIKSLNVASEAVNESTPPALSQSDLANRSAA